MAEIECGNSHVIDMEAEDENPICVVCMEPMEWVAVSPCGHREVCVRCAASIRFFHNDLRCCICRSHCSTVVVTKANRSASAQRGFPFFLWPPSPAFASQVLVGHYYWYHHGMRAYFDDVHQYQAMNKVCTTTSPSSSEEESRAAGAAPVVNYVGRYRDALFPQPAPNANVNLNVSVPPRQAAGAPPPLEEPSSSSDVGTQLVCFAILLSLLTTGGFLMVAKHPYPKVLIVVLVSVLFPAFTGGTIYAWRKFSNNSLGDG